jgi:hypothetical protein
MSARAIATETAALDPNPDATGMVEVIVTRIGSNGPGSRAANVA